MTRTAIALVLMFEVAAVLSAVPQRDASPAGVRLRGVVSDERSGNPLKHARVSVQWTGGRSQPVLTDDRGRFDVGVANAGAYSIALAKAGSAPQTQRLGRDAVAEPIALRMARGAVLTGTAFDRNGDPVAGIGVNVRRVDPDTASFVPGEAWVTDTDDHGEFRVGSLPGGRFAVTLYPVPLVSVGLLQKLQPEIDSRTLVELRAGQELAIARVFEEPESGTTSPAADVAGRATASADPRSAGIEGRLFAANGRPLAGLSISITPLATGSTRLVQSDGSGRYAIDRLSAGTVQIAVTPRGGGMEPQRIGTVTLERGDRLANIDLAMPAGSSISGVVVDDLGEPLEGLAIRLMERKFSGGLNTIVAHRGAVRRRTDDRGQYRIYGVMPGTYYLTVIEETLEGDLQLPIAVRQVYYPGSDAPADALTLQIEPGRDVAGVNVAVPSSRFTRVYGRVVDSAGQPLRSTLQSLQSARVAGDRSSTERISASVLLSLSSRSATVIPPGRSVEIKDGTFEFLNVPPGDYVIQARAEPYDPMKEPYAQRSGEFATAFLTVGGGEVPISMQTAPGSSLKGRVVVQGGTSDDLPFDVTITAVPADSDLSPRARSTRVPGAAPFELTGLIGAHRVVVDGIPPEWWLKSVEIDGINAADDPIMFGGRNQSRSGVDVVVSSAGGEISGRVTGGTRGREGALVLVFPMESSLWYHRSRFLKLVPADPDSGFSVTGLPPGEYCAVAVDAGALNPFSDEWRNPALLATLAASARRVTVGEGGRVSVELRRSPMSR